ncbi:small multidrug efflux protein [Microbacterium sp. zg.B48]|uniref:small multidrug efflux protein n=1 Tax=unclassified Microbacterium TaxID=2609290 RepID=UPI00214B72A0|nr:MULTISPECIES: small multidrug efflux protein [unclassified Microbacterium]MCR2762463.1 small multidrug efflux protein [Microbacterium sp. zg.B48]MCR2810607.1 small multidrug efflux protein [Microbacterium sp. zg.B185]WIM18144.1 small multidrug efflux protein [Microbacterium sp. zg-B185]
MNPIQDLIIRFQELVAQVPEFIQPFIVMLAGAVPFIEGELGATIGIAGGLNPILAAVAAAGGNFLSVLVVVLLTSRARTAVVNRTRVPVGVAAGAAGSSTSGGDEFAAPLAQADAKPQSKGRARFNRWLIRFGVPGASILGPLAIPTQITSAILVAGGTSRAWVLLWQAVAIVLWTTVSTVLVWAALTFLVGV